jgi:nucleoside-diphosphate-sugar epimerase
VRVLVSGASGFIGGHLASEVARNRHDVVALMRRKSATTFEFQEGVQVEIADLAVEAEALPAGPFDVLVHCAAAIPSAVPDQAELVRINVGGTCRLFEHVLAAGAKLIVFCSSMAVYGRINADVVDRDTPISAPGPYGRSKLASEEKLADLSRDHAGLRALSIRLPGIVGPGSHDNFLSDTVRRLSAGETISLRNPNALFNNVVHIDALAGFVCALLETLPTGHRVTTIGTVEPLPIRDVVGILGIAAASGAEIHYREEGHSFLISNDHAQTLGYRPETVRTAVERLAAGWAKTA